MANSNKPIRAEELTAYERWELPTIEGGAGALEKVRSAVARKPVKPLTADDIEKIRQEAYQAGFDEGKQAGFEQGKQEGQAVGVQEGRKKGFDQGVQQGQASIDQTVAQLRQCMQNLTNPISEQGQLVEQAMLNIALAISRAVIHRELSIDTSQIAQTISMAIHNLPDFSKSIKIHLNPNDAKYAEQAIKDLDCALDIVANTGIQPGGCQLETSSQLVDFTIEKRFQKTVQSMLFEAMNEKDVSVSQGSTSINELSDYSPETLGEIDAEKAAGSITEKEPSETDSPSANATEPSNASVGDTEIIEDPDESLDQGLTDDDLTKALNAHLDEQDNESEQSDSEGDGNESV